MTAITLPINSKDFSPTLTPITKDSTSWFNKIVEWIRSAESKGLIHKVCIYVITIFTSFLLIGSIVFSPVFIFGFKEYIRQCERAYYDKAFAHLLEIAQQKAEFEFVRGRVAPLESLNVKLNPSTRTLIIKNLEIPEKDAKEMSDSHLLIMAAAKYPEFIPRYKLRITS